MTTPDDSDTSPAPVEQKSDPSGPEDALSIVDLFDQMDRESFKRSLEQRDTTFFAADSTR